MSDRNVLLTHYDLDGVGCDILLSKIFTFSKKVKCGYSKAADYISKGEFSGFDACMVTDMSLNYTQFMQLSLEYGKKLLYIDHHKASVNMINDMEVCPSSCAMSDIFSATGITFQTFEKVLSGIPGVFPFVVAVDSYDSWRVNTHGSTFADGYDLNTLFWKYKYNDFYNRFSRDFNLTWTTQEQDWLNNHARERDDAIRISDKNDFGKNSLLVLDAPGGFINDYGLVFPEYDFFYLMYPSLSGNMAMSIRTTLKGVDVGKAIVNARQNQPFIHTGGGHREAGGLEFVDGTTLNLILDIVERINNELEGVQEAEVPF